MEIDYSQLLESARAAAGVTGASFAYWDGVALHTAVAGLRNSVTGDPLTLDTVMQTGSITKVMNAALMMQLVDEGRIALHDPIIEHIPELRLRDTNALARITCAMLLNHTSGINCDWLPEFGPDQERIVDAIHRCPDLEQLHAPGEATSYCNIASVIAGYLTQRVRGVSWYTLMKTHLFEPLDMRHSLVDPLELPRFRCSIGDATDFRTGRFVQTTRPILAPSFAPAGATQMTSASDLVTFARALVNGGVGPNGARMLSAGSAGRMATATGEFDSPAGWKMGLGWMIAPDGLLHHSGSGRGVSSQLYAQAGSGRVVALLTNCDRGSTLLRPAILDPILESWIGYKAQAASRQSTPVNPAPYVGVYENNLHRFEVLAGESGLTLRQSIRIGNLFDFERSLVARLYPLGDQHFEVEYETPGMSRGTIRFVRPDANGRMRTIASGYHLLPRAG
jgi:CubicO group peptidase (beta-lactamase class C family)